MTAARRILVVYASQTGRTAAMAQAVMHGIAAAGGAVQAQLLPALQAGVDELMACDALLIGTPENFGYMSGAVKDFLDRTYYPCEGRRVGLPYALFVSAGNDGSGAVRALERIALGYGWKPIAEALIVQGEPGAEALQRCSELGAAMAAGLDCGIF